MNRIVTLSLLATLGTASFFAMTKNPTAAPPATTSPLPPQSACSLPEHRQLDFWIGDWDAFDIDDAAKTAARAQIDGILEGCVIHERYDQIDGLKGESFSLYDSSRGVWHQTWVTNRGTLLVAEGKFEAGEMKLAGVVNVKGVRKLVRVSWKPMEGGVRETAVTSTDDGKTWNTLFDMGFRPHRP